MRTISTLDAETRFRELLDAARVEPITITDEGRPAAVVMSATDYERMRGAAWDRLFATIATARVQAAERGLTDELLDELLANES